MKLYCATLSFALMASVSSAFCPTPNKAQALTTSTALSMALDMPSQEDIKGYYTKLDERNAQMDGATMAASMNFDPLEFSKTEGGLFFQREAEIKHARLAMLAAAGWPLAELFDEKLANIFGLDPVVDATSRNPDILNGGLDKVSPLYWGFILGTAAVIDIVQIQQANDVENNPDYIPGDLGFDPLGLYPKDKKGQLEMQAKEIRNGRLAMIAVTAFAFQEYVQQSGIVEHSSIFFKPFGF